MTTKAGPLRLLAAAVQRGEWLPDRGQQHTATLLQAVYEGTSRGTYLHGPVGSGKTALMDLLVRSCDAGQVRRLHFHELMGHVHRELHRGAAVPAIGAELVAAAPLLAVDEMQLTDIADAAIVSRLVAAVCSSEGARLVLTSNRAPQDLYEGGLNRHVHIPALCKALDENGVGVHQLASEHGDYRERSVAGPRAVEARFHHPPSAATTTALRHGVNAAAAALGESSCLARAWMPLGGGRRLPLEHAAGGACLVSFQALCGSPLGAADYLTLSRRYHTVAIRDVPQLTPDMHNEARAPSATTRCLASSTPAHPEPQAPARASIPRRHIFTPAAAPPPRGRRAASSPFWTFGTTGAASSSCPPPCRCPQSSRSFGQTRCARPPTGRAPPPRYAPRPRPRPRPPARISPRRVHPHKCRTQYLPFSLTRAPPTRAANGAQGADAAASVRGAGGSSSGWATTYIGAAGDTEWSATGRMGVSLAGLAGLNDAAFAQRRAASRLQEMLGSEAWAAATASTGARVEVGGDDVGAVSGTA